MTALDEQSRPALGRGVRLRNDPITGEPLLLYPEGFLPLDATAHDILSRCSGTVTIESLIHSLAEEYDADYATMRPDVCDCLEELRQRMLIAITQ